MAYTPNPFDHTGTVDTSNYGAPIQSETFGATGAAGDSGMPTAGSRSVVTPESVAVVVTALDQDANLTTVASDRTAYQAFVASRTRQSLAN